MKKLFTILFAAFLAANSIAQTFTVAPTLDGQTIITNTSSTLNYTKWQIEYGPTGYTPGTGTLVPNITTVSKTIVINPLVSYDFRIQNGYGASYFNWTAVTTYSNCSDTATPLPYTYNFDGNAIQDCWRGYSTPENSNGILLESSSVHYGSSGSSAHLSFDFSISGSAVLVAPKFSGLNTEKMVTFLVKGYVGSVLKVGTFSNPYDTATFHEIQTVPVQANAQNWFKIYVPLTNYNGTDQYVGLKFDNSTGMGDIYIDNFTCMPVCNSVTGLNMSNIGEHSAQLNFTAPGQDTWQITVTTPGITPQLYTSSSNPFTIPNLIPNTPYQVQMRAVCGLTNESEWSETISFTTICNPISTGYSTSFEGDYSLDPCWSRIATNESNVSMQNGLYNGSLPVLSPKTGSKLLWMNNTFNTFQQPMYLISPYIDSINNTKRLSLFLASNSTALEKNVSSLIIGTVASPDDMSTFHQIKEITPAEMNEIHNLHISGDSWKEHIIYFNNYSNVNNHHYLVLKHNGITQPNIFLIDDLTFEEIPACTEPVDLKLVERWWDHVTVSWVNNYSGSTSAEWQIEYGPAGFASGSGTVINVTSNPATINNLQDDTEYEFYVRSKCGANYSGWSDKGHFRTRCTGITVGYTYGFEDEVLSEFNPCWERIMPKSDYAAYTENTDCTTLDQQVSSGWVTHSGTKLLSIINRLSPFDTEWQKKSILIMPRLLDFNNEKKVSFWMNVGPNANGAAPVSESVIVGTMSDPDDYTTFTPFYTIIDAMDYIDQWKQYTINFSTYTGTDEYVAIKQAVGNAEHRIFFDDFAYNNVGCEVPSFLTAEQTGNNQVTFTWNNGNNPNPPSQWQIEYGPIGFTEGEGTTATVTSNPASLDGLSQFIKYEYHVKNICGVQNGDWSQRLPFRVSCSVTAPFTENFDQYSFGTNFPDEFCWTDNTFSSPSLQEVCLDEVSSCPNAYSIAVASVNNNPNLGLLISPYLSDFDNSKKIRFYVRDYYQSGHNLIVGTMTNPMDSSTFVPYTTISLAGNSTSGKQSEVNFENYTGTANHFAFRLDNESSNVNYTYIDDIQYLEAAACSEPLNVSPYNITANSALINWDVVANAQGYEIEYGPAGFIQSSGTTLTADTNQKLLTGLNPSTQYHYYVKTICSGTPNSIWVGPKSFTTTCEALSLPWVEDFSSMTEYGENKLPECFRNLSENTVTSHNTAVADPWNYEPDNLMSGADDTSFVHINTGFTTNMVTPMFSLIAGTTYKFSFMGRKGYQFSSYGYNVSTGRGNTYQAMDTFLYAEGQLQQTGYEEMSYHFTPLVSGDYSFSLNFIASGGFNLILDKFQLQEGYASVIDNNDAEYDFENGISEDLVVESTGETWTSLYNEPDGNTSLFMQAGVDPEEWQDTEEVPDFPDVTPFSNPGGNDVWLNNKNFVTKVNMKVDASQMESLSLSFDLKQTAETDVKNSRFRVMINGEQTGIDITPETLDQDIYTSHEFDLTPYVGGPVYISLQHIGKSSYNTGDQAILDNIKLNGVLLVDTKNFELTGLKLYPNPVKDIVTLENTDVISAIEIYNISGQKLFSQQYTLNQVQLDLSAYSDGIYFIKAICNEKEKTFKVVKR